jgi:RNA 2',3'-cyclic 3'-phosphodiesterase
MRYFIALEIPDESKKQLQDVQNELKKIIPQAKLTDNDKLHITIAFIGEQPDDIQAKLVDAIEVAARGIPPFILTPGYIDGFPNLHNPNIIWVGVKDDIDKLFLIRERIKDALVDLALTVDERRYTPHIAIAKLRNDYHLNSEHEKQLEQLMLAQYQPIQVTALKLFKSTPDHGFHQHNTLAQIPLI